MDKAALTNVLRNSLGGVPANTLRITGKPEAVKMAVMYEASGNKNVDLMIAVVQKNAIRQIKRGENGGPTLRHVQIVRKLGSFKLSNTRVGEVSVSLPNEFSLGEWEVIYFFNASNPSSNCWLNVPIVIWFNSSFISSRIALN